MLVVAKYLDGRTVKGRTTDFHPREDVFHLDPEDGGAKERLTVRGLKALFCVRSTSGNPGYRDHRDFPDSGGKVRPRLWLRFRDGERMAAFPVFPSLGERGFWVLPTDPESNVERAWIYRDSLTEILEGREAVVAARTEARKRREQSSAEMIKILWD